MKKKEENRVDRRHNILWYVRLKKTFYAHTDGGLLMDS